MTKRNEFIYNTLGILFPDAHCELNYHNNFELLIAVVLSAQTTDQKVNKVTSELFGRYEDCKKLANAEFIDVKEIITPLGLASGKAKNIIALSKRLVDEKNGEVVNDFEYLITLPGVGRKTANVVLSEAFGENRLGVDTHVARTSNRLGLTNSLDPLQVEKDLVREFDGIKLHTLHHRLIFFGRYLCKKQKPECSRCPFKEYCNKENNSR